MALAHNGDIDGDVGDEDDDDDDDEGDGDDDDDDEGDGDVEGDECEWGCADDEGDAMVLW